MPAATEDYWLTSMFLAHIHTYHVENFVLKHFDFTNHGSTSGHVRKCSGTVTDSCDLRATRLAVRTWRGAILCEPLAVCGVAWRCCTFLSTVHSSGRSSCRSELSAGSVAHYARNRLTKLEGESIGAGIITEWYASGRACIHHSLGCTWPFQVRNNDMSRK